MLMWVQPCDVSIKLLVRIQKNETGTPTHRTFTEYLSFEWLDVAHIFLEGVDVKIGEEEIFFKVLNSN